MGEHKITIYSTTTCPFCKMAKKYFEEKGLAYENFDVATDQNARAVMVEKSSQMGVPVIDIDGKIVVGFDRPQIELLLSK